MNLWCVKMPDGSTLPFTCSGTRRVSIHKITRLSHEWRRLYRQGYRCVKVRIVELGGET